MKTETIRRTGHNEDGDYVMVRTIEVSSIVEAKEVTRMLNDEVNLNGCKVHSDIRWSGKGGKLVWNDTYVVDCAEVAIEANNDAWACSCYDPEWD